MAVRWHCMASLTQLCQHPMKDPSGKTAVPQVNTQLRALNLPHTEDALNSSLLCTILPQSKLINCHSPPYRGHNQRPLAVTARHLPPHPPTKFRVADVFLKTR